MKFRSRIRLSNRYGYDNYLLLTKVDESGTIGSYTLSFDSRSNFFRSGFDGDGTMFVDPEGGPFLQAGSTVGRFTVKEVIAVDSMFVVRLGV